MTPFPPETRRDHRHKATAALDNAWIVMRRELRAYFTSPIALVVFGIFHIVVIWLTLYGTSAGGPTVTFWERAYADMNPFFELLPWLLLFFVPALSMRLWAEERQVGSIELLLTLPMRPGEILVGKFLGAWFIVAVMLFLPFISMLALLLRIGDPDVGQIVASYFGAVLLGGAQLALGSLISSLTKDQIIAFIVTVLALGIITFMGSETALNALSGIGGAERIWQEGRQLATESISIGQILAEIAQKLSLASRFTSIGRGVLDLADIAYYVVFIGFFLYLNSIVLSLKR